MRKKKGTKIGVREEKRGGKERSRHMLPNTVLISARMNDHTLDINCSSPFCWSSCIIRPPKILNNTLFNSV